jgi:hypothetical protein
MPPVPPLKRALGSVLLAALLVLAGPVSVLAAPQPSPGYQPAFVTEREQGPWEDCIWAAASMLLDKWTSGSRIVSRERLRSLSGDRTGGSGLADVRRAFDKLGMRLTFSPGGGESISWNALLDRLANGGGAIVLGDYHYLPSRYGRWDPDFWSRSGTGDDHALYLDRYDRRGGRILVMDPLAPAGWGGEWIPASAIKKFVWRTSGGSLWAAVTPAARVLAPFEGVALGSATAEAHGATVGVSWPVETAPQTWTFRGATVTTDLAPLGAIDPSLPVLLASASAAPADALPAPSASAANGVVRASVAAPVAPGLYRLTVGLGETTTGRGVGSAGPFALYVAGPRAATITVHPKLVIDAGGQAQIPVQVVNSGSESWVDPPLVGWLSLDAQRIHEVRVVGRWVDPTAAAPGSPGGSAATGTGIADVARDPGLAPAPAGPIDLGSLHLETGDHAALVATIQAPTQPGSWLLVFEAVDHIGRPLALTGSAPGIVVVDVRAPDSAPAELGAESAPQG